MKTASESLNDTNYSIPAFLCALVTSLGFCVASGRSLSEIIGSKTLEGSMLFGVFNIEIISHALRTPSYFTLITLVFVCIAYQRILTKMNFKLLKWSVPFALCSALITVLCESYYQQNSWVLVFGSATAMLLSALRMAGLSVMIVFAFDLVNRIEIPPRGRRAEAGAGAAENLCPSHRRDSVVLVSLLSRGVSGSYTF